MEPKVSILCAVYNKEEYIVETINSVLNQTYVNFEFIIMDDGSTDSTVEKILQFNDPRIILFKHTINKGQSLRIHEMIGLAKGEYIGWIDGDDMLDSRCIEYCEQALNNQPQYGLVYTDHYEIDSEGRVLDIGYRCKLPYSPEALLYNFMTFHFRLFRKNVYDYCESIDTSLRIGGDYDLCLKMSEVTRILHLPLPLYYYRYSSSSESINRQSYMDNSILTILRNTLIRRKQDHITVSLTYDKRGLAKYVFNKS